MSEELSTKWCPHFELHSVMKSRKKFHVQKQNTRIAKFGWQPIIRLEMKTTEMMELVEFVLNILNYNLFL